MLNFHKPDQFYQASILLCIAFISEMRTPLVRAEEICSTYWPKAFYEVNEANNLIFPIVSGNGENARCYLYITSYNRTSKWTKTKTEADSDCLTFGKSIENTASRLAIFSKQAQKYGNFLDNIRKKVGFVFIGNMYLLYRRVCVSSTTD